MAKDLERKEYYLGLDCGTSSVGFAVTDTDYNVLKFNGKSMWGSHLFEEAKTAKERRIARCLRRRRERQRQRINLLQELFAEEVAKKDPTFFIRLNDSGYLVEDKDERVRDKNILFGDEAFKDKDFFKLYPTAYHLRVGLIHEGTKDPRILYLGLHHILKHRGHFLFPGNSESMASVADLNPLAEQLKKAFLNVFETELFISSNDKLQEALRARGNANKLEGLDGIISIGSGDSKLKKNLSRILVGYKVKADVFFDNDDYKDLCAIEFKKSSFEETDLPVLEGALSEDEFELVITMKAVFDWILFSNIMGGNQYISEAKVALFNQNRKDLRLLKELVKKYCSRDQYDGFFHSLEKGFFSSYVGKNHDRNKSTERRVKRSSTEDFYKEVRKILDKMNLSDPDVVRVKEAVENDSFLPLLSSFRNGVIPYQVNMIELSAILDKAKENFKFLYSVDEDGITPSEKIKAIMRFRIPYYVGPIGHNDEKPNPYAWMERREQGRILPWNFNEKIDVEGSAEKFIERMTNKCTYCKDQDVLAKNSIAYSKYLVLSELNNLRINGDRFPVERKQFLFDNLFCVNKKVTKKSLLRFLFSEGWYSKNELTVDDITGLESDFKSSMSSYIDFKPYLESGKLKADDVDLIIKWITIFSEGGQILQNRIRKYYGSVLTDDEITAISRLKYAGWGRFSHKFLYEIQAVNPETGELMSIVRMMWNTKFNLMELLGDAFEFKLQVTDDEKLGKLDYRIVDDLYVSPAVKRQIWQTLRIVDEIEKIMKHPPKKVFVETTRSEQEKKRTVSRRNDLIFKLKEAQKADEGFGQEIRQMLSELEGKTESQISIQDKLYLYFTQCGRCMYTGRPIDIDDLYNVNIYDTDHIYPYSKSNDDSLVNKVLVLKDSNARKSNDYPISDSVRKDMAPFWKMLKDKGFIPKEKYDRLTRSTPLTDLDTQGFISRQLVETSQTTKAVAETLKAYFSGESRIVYSKAKNVSKFRDENGFIKCRSMNDLHHAKDAYLNIVVGNVLDTKYTSDFFRYSDGTGYGNLSKPFEFDVRGAWKKGPSGTISVVKKTMARNNVLFTRQPVTRSGQLFDLQIVPKGSKAGALPVKSSDKRVTRMIESGMSREEAYAEWTGKYGGYNSLSTAYFALVLHTEKKKRYASFIPISMVDSERLSSPDALKRYCIEELGFTDADVRSARLLMNSTVEFDGFRFSITGKSNGGKTITLSSSVPLVLSEESQLTLKRAESFLRKSSENRGLVVDSNHDGLTEDNTRKLFTELVSKTKEQIYRKRPGNQNDLLQGEAAMASFASLSLNDRVIVIRELMNYFGMKSGLSDLTLIGGSKACGTLTKSANNDLSKTRIAIVNQSITGLFEKKVNIS